MSITARDGGGLSPALLLLNLLFNIRLNVCYLLYIRLNVYPLPPLNGNRTETYSNFNAIYKFEIDH